MKLHELLQGIEVLEQNADPELELTGVSYDSRSTAPGELFAAISGYATDGHRFIPAALARGAACVLCEHDMPEHTPWVRVRDARAALAQLGCNWFGHPAERLCMIGVTGTNGKTTVTCLVKHVLEQTLGAKVGLIGTIENRIGDTVLPTERTTPESFALQGLLRQMLDAGCTHVVMEVSSHALALHRVDGIPFTVGAFTNLTEDHLDFHKTMEAYGAAKARLFRLCRTGVLNADDPAYRTMADVLVVTSDNPRTEEPMAIIREILAGIPQTEKPVYVEENRRRAIRMTLRFAQKDDMIVLAGKGHETYQVLGTEKIHFDEREEVAACLQEEDHEQ